MPVYYSFCLLPLLLSDCILPPNVLPAAGAAAAAELLLPLVTLLLPAAPVIISL